MDNELIERLKNITSLTLADMRNPEKIGIMLAAINDGIVAIKELEAKLETATKALESIATHSDGIPGDEGDDAFYDYCEVKDLAAAALKAMNTTTGENDEIRLSL